MVKERLEGASATEKERKKGKVASVQERCLFGDGHYCSLMTVINLMMVH